MLVGKGSYSSNPDTSKYEQHSLELKVCEECEVRHSHKFTEEYYDSKKDSSQKGSNPPSYRGDSTIFTLLPERRTNTPTLIANDDSRKPTGESFIGDKPDPRYYSEKPEYNHERDPSVEKNSWRGAYISKGEGTFGYNSQRNKSLLDESPIRRQDTNNSSGIWDRDIPDPKKHRFESDRERMIQYSREFESHLQKIADNTESNLKKDFDKAAHSILHNHVDSARKNKENDYAHRNKYLNEIADQDERANMSFEKPTKLERSYISDGHTREDSRITYSTNTKYGGKSPSVVTPGVTHNRQANVEDYYQPEDDRELNYVSYSL